MGGGERQKMKEKEQGIAWRMDAVQRREREVRRKEWEEGGGQRIERERRDLQQREWGRIGNEIREATK